METYIFYLCTDNAVTVSLEVRTLQSDDFALDWARKILAQHPGADYVTAARGEVTLVTVRREAAVPVRPVIRSVLAD